ncbi:putative glutamine-serine rich protein MS8 [Aspergillus ruber CBS 135680]|uniref:Uncharacterized protein n=1 Tax=Aspergillus ruber (strain CBS 135680) TaxID=1388766 RepID=A0A017SNY1_ASPRC|nr:uncharacterized protein EURHEDRAFT_220371 [Aspergillus ruber CBS 135680]EYE98678.1 hypothetical protein EURHEDRAFT_220371 [Aspergillus ruber CBS 135680]
MSDSYLYQHNAGNNPHQYGEQSYYSPPPQQGNYPPAQSYAPQQSYPGGFLGATGGALAGAAGMGLVSKLSMTRRRVTRNPRRSPRRSLRKSLGRKK